MKNSLKVRYPNQIDVGKFCEGFQKWNGSSKEEEEEEEEAEGVEEEAEVVEEAEMGCCWV